ncbi:hypothetical protein F4V91_06825 [Neorhizobium galegae]|uniref:Uncharacterized protein n=1 Tax=Neorhizobium galegae TaxID=399 RepID=A0A6A1TNA7_NEOGA|nr:hypothetical protein [Neorhizobium galegae]KAB1086172.1 hypothetical protein F4V91_06825 [Neorhizobium galegae]
MPRKQYNITNSSAAIAGDLINGFEWQGLQIGYRDRLLEQGLPTEEVDFQVAAAKVMRAVHKIHCLTGTERKLGSDENVSAAIYDDMR